MDQLIDNRMSKSLINHNLENLVFEKRQRKTVQSLPLLYFNKHTSDKSPTKKIPPKHTVKIEKKTSKNHPINKVSRIERKSINKPTIKKINKVKRKVSEISELSEELVIEQSVVESKNDASFQQKQKQKKKSDPKNKSTGVKQPKPRLSAQKEKKTSLASNKKSSSQQKQQSIQQDRLKIEEKESSQNGDENQQINNQQNQKRARGRPRKSKTQQNQISPKQQQVLQQPNDLIINQSTVKMQKPTILNISKQLIQIQKDQTNQVQNTRARKAKLNPLTKYNQNDEEMYSDYSSQTQKEAKRKKKIFKQKGKNKLNKPYQLNRIFRKQAKKNFSSFQINVNFNYLSLRSFLKQFGTFDLIHFSLPLQFLHLLPEIPLLMQKGFIFVWVEHKQTQIGYHLLNRWGYDVIDQIIWIKANQEQGKIQADNLHPSKTIMDPKEEDTNSKELFINMKSTCLVGYKCPLGNKAEYRTKVSNNIIFAKLENGCKKPEEIYEIADLMMPGAKKLQFGGPAQKGWLNLKHNQKTLYRCHSCFRQQSLYVLHEETTVIKCKKCIIDELKPQNGDEIQHEVLSKQFGQLSKSKIKQILYVQKMNTLKCLRCGKEEDELQYLGLIKEPDSSQFMCSKCFHIKSANTSTPKSVQIVLSKKYYYNSTQITCASCQSQTIYDIYFECTKCKNHKICKKCFWKTSQSLEQTPLDKQNKRSSKANVHEWRLKFVKNNPLMKFGCFSCKCELSLPFWSCQTCQSWAWCGKCDRGSSEVHPHYQTDQHKEYLII